MKHPKTRSAPAVADPEIKTIRDQDIETKRWPRRAFMKAVGGTSFLFAAGAAAAGCSEPRSDTCRTTIDNDPRDGSRVSCDGD